MENGPIPISINASYGKISLSLEVARFVFRIVQSLWNLTGDAAACQISKKWYYSIYQFRDFETSQDLTIRRIVGYWNVAQSGGVSKVANKRTSGWLGLFSVECEVNLDTKDVNSITQNKSFTQIFRHTKQRENLSLINKTNLRDFIAATGLVILLIIDNLFVPYDLEIWQMTSKNNRAASSLVHHFIIIKLELWSRVAKLGFWHLWPWPLNSDLEPLHEHHFFHW